jgi:pSer/pThr/pTyr-binding forkhead associated (FHA) protein
MKCLNKKPADRYPDANVLTKELRNYRAHQPATASGSHATLAPVVLVCEKTNKAIPLNGTSNTIGRSSECQIVVKSLEVSKRHCRILVKDDEVTVEDLASVNGTLVNDEPVTEALLNDGDVLEVGDCRYKVRLTRKPKSTGD